MEDFEVMELIEEGEVLEKYHITIDFSINNETTETILWPDEV